MSDLAEKLLFLFLDVILPLAAGYFMRRRGLMTMKACNFLLKVNIRVVVAVLAFGSFWLIELDHHIILFALLGIVPCSMIPGLIAYAYAKNRIRDLSDQGSYLLSVMLSNTGTLGGLCTFIAMGQLAYAYVQIIAMAQNIFTLTYCFPMAEYFRQKYVAGKSAVKFRPNWKSILISWNQIGLAAMVAGALFNIFGIERPPQFDAVFDSCVHISAWLGILPVGYLLNFEAAAQYKKMIFSIVPNRYIITPFICWVIAKAFTDDPMIIAVAVLMGLCPVGINATVVTQLYNLNTNIAQSNFLLTTMLFIFVIYPLFLLFII